MADKMTTPKSTAEFDEEAGITGDEVYITADSVINPKEDVANFFLEKLLAETLIKHNTHDQNVINELKAEIARRDARILTLREALEVNASVVVAWRFSSIGYDDEGRKAMDDAMAMADAALGQDEKTEG